MTTFQDLGLSSDILKALKDLGFEKPTEIQQEAIPVLLTGTSDLIGLAQTGTGKTAAFGLPLLDKIDPQTNATQGLILAPTRELGKQIAVQLELFSKHSERINTLAVYGGAPIMNQIKALKKTRHIIIATPGRLIDLIKRKAVKLDQLRYLVLDEADEMLNMGFKEEIDKILAYTPEEKNTWLFSATMPKEIKNIVNRYMTDPTEIRINPKNEVNKNIKHIYLTVRPRDKQEALKRFLDLYQNMRGVVFCRTRRDTQMLAEDLLSKNYKADALHGDLSQAQRDRVMGRFRANELQVLIATDVAARGIDVSDLSHVFHYTLPDDVPYYTHRSGRTARAGNKGVSIAFVSGREVHRIKRLENALKINFKKIEVPSAEEIAKIRIKRWCTDIINKQTDGRLDEQLLEQAKSAFGNLTKEELVAKILLIQIEHLHLIRGRDLNDKETSGGDRDRRRGGGGGGRGRDRDRGRRRFGGGANHRGGGGSGGSGKKRRPSSSRFSKPKKR